MNDFTTVTADTLNRAVKIALDTGEVGSIEDAYRLFQTYRLGIYISAEAASSPAHQAALLTMVNIGRRSLLGGVSVTGAVDVSLGIDQVGGFATLAEAIVALGGEVVDALPDNVPTLILGDDAFETAGIALKVTFGDWRSAVIPAGENGPVQAEQPNAILPAICAAALGVSEIFQHLRGNPYAGRRTVGFSLWHIDSPDWENAPVGPSDYVVPARLWLIGLGHLGQAYLWVLGLLPYADAGAVQLTLQDFDRLTLSNDSTSVLTTATQVGRRKTREMARWVEARGFSAKLVERRFTGDIVLQPDDARVALCGVDNLEARAALEQPAFDLVVEAGLGAGPSEFLAMRLHIFPSSLNARERWASSGERAASANEDAPSYTRLAEQGMDHCGLVQLASRTVGAPFVGVFAACIAITEVIKRLNGAKGFEVVDLSLSDLSGREVVSAPIAMTGFNPGFAELRRGI